MNRNSHEWMEKLIESKLNTLICVAVYIYQVEEVDMYQYTHLNLRKLNTKIYENRLALIPDVPNRTHFNSARRSERHSALPEAAARCPRCASAP